jgi:hypothetical protein
MVGDENEGACSMTDPHAEKAQELVARHQRELEQIRADTRLSPAGKLQRVARSYLVARDGAAAAKQEAAAAREAERRKIEERLFRPPTAPGAAENIARQASYRDALERASRVSSPAEIAAMLDLARITGDDLQEQAIVAVATKRQDTDALKAYLQQRPEAEPDLQRLLDLTSPPTAADAFTEAMKFAGPQRPQEIGRASDQTLLRIAEGE